MAAQKSEKAKKKHGRETRSAMITAESNYHVLDDMILSRSGSGLCNRGQDFLAVDHPFTGIGEATKFFGPPVYSDRPGREANKKGSAPCGVEPYFRSRSG
jgi:hypothetical protein